MQTPVGEMVTQSVQQRLFNYLQPNREVRSTLAARHVELLTPVTGVRRFAKQLLIGDAGARGPWHGHRPPT